ncbi:hypothetical protein TrVE_jg5490 [Triparma verrucosa]|uniref:SAM domain-containing protein n=1 Tax=Triparma verrucosa TaxID=1606542 RepID=A0A9W7FMA0_9STRA|nr:hypothetical protein TrVE_jg5490 [Triparma verrucosa]
MPSSRRTSHAGLSSPAAKRSGRERSSSVSVRGMASPDLIAGISLGSPSMPQPRRVSIGGVHPMAMRSTKEQHELKIAIASKLEPKAEFRGVNAKAVRTTQEQMEMKAKIETGAQRQNIVLHRRKSIEEESDASSDDASLDPTIANVVSRSSITHGPDSPQYVTARKLYEANNDGDDGNMQPKPPSPSQPKRAVGAGPVSIRNLRYDTVENSQMKNIIHELEEREVKRRASEEIEHRKVFKQVQVEKSQDLEIHDGHLQRESPPASSRSSPHGSRHASPTIPSRTLKLPEEKPIPDEQKPLLFVYVRTANLTSNAGEDEEWLNASLELEIFPRADATKKVCKNITACSNSDDAFHFHSFVKLDVHPAITAGQTIVKKSKKDKAVTVPQLKITAKGAGAEHVAETVKGVATMPMADVSLFGFKDYNKTGEGTDIPMSLMRDGGGEGLFGKVFVRLMYIRVEDRDDKGCRRLAKRIFNEANEERKKCLQQGKSEDKAASKKEAPAVEPLEVPPQGIDLSMNLGMNPPSEMDRAIERQNLQHQSTMETLNATAQLLAQTVAMIGAKTANDVRAKEEEHRPEWEREPREASRGGSRKGSNASNNGSTQNSPTNYDPMARKRSRRENLEDKPVLMWGVVDVATWLSSKQVGLAPYANMFVNQAVDGLAFVSMSEDQLDDFGIFNASHKKKLLLHIARFRALHKEELDAIDLEVENMVSKRRQDLDEGEASSDEEEDWSIPKSNQDNSPKSSKGKSGKERNKAQSGGESRRKKTSDYPKQAYNFANSPINSQSSKKKKGFKGGKNSGSRSPAQRSSGSSRGESGGQGLTPQSLSPSMTPQTLSNAGSSSSLSDSDAAIRGRRSSQDSSLLTFDNPSRASRVVTEANEDRADTVLYTNMMKDVWKMV